MTEKPLKSRPEKSDLEFFRYQSSRVIFLETPLEEGSIVILAYIKAFGSRNKPDETPASNLMDLVISKQTAICGTGPSFEPVLGFPKWQYSKLSQIERAKTFNKNS
jgi:hypothetical protein